jgi:hypothetical protein
MSFVVTHKDGNTNHLQYQEDEKVEITTYEKKYIPHLIKIQIPLTKFQKEKFQIPIEAVLTGIWNFSI